MLGLIFWVFILLLALSYVGISIGDIINSPAGQANLTYILNLFSQFFDWLQNALTELIRR